MNIDLKDPRVSALAQLMGDPHIVRLVSQERREIARDALEEILDQAGDGKTVWMGPPLEFIQAVIHAVQWWESVKEGIKDGRISGISNTQPMERLAAGTSVANTFLMPDTERLQAEVSKWVLGTFGPEVANSTQERAMRVMEEALELAQVEYVPLERILNLARYVYGRDPGYMAQEAAQVMVTLLAYAGARKISLKFHVDQEFERINTPEMIEKCRAKQQFKTEMGQTIVGEGDHGEPEFTDRKQLRRSI